MSKGETTESRTQEIFEVVIAKNFPKTTERHQNTDPGSSVFQYLDIPCSKCRKTKMKRKIFQETRETDRDSFRGQLTGAEAQPPFRKGFLGEYDHKEVKMTLK